MGIGNNLLGLQGTPIHWGAISAAYHSGGSYSLTMSALRCFLALLAVMSLDSCQVLGFVFSSVFPATATLAKAQANLSGKIPAGSGSSFSVRVVESGSYGYVVVIGNLASTGNTAFFYDLNLNPVATFTSLAAGGGVMTDANDNIALGAQLLSSNLQSSTQYPPNVVSNGNLGIDGFVVQGTDNVTDISIMNGNVLGDTYVNASWGNIASVTPPTSSPISNVFSSLYIEAIFDDGNPQGNVILVISPTSGGNNVTSYFVTLPKTDFTPTTYTQGILDSSPQRSNLETQSFGFAQGSVFAYDKDSSSFVRINPATGATQSSFYSGTDPSQTKYAYLISGGTFYGFDTTARVLTKYTAWW